MYTHEGHSRNSDGTEKRPYGEKFFIIWTPHNSWKFTIFWKRWGPYISCKIYNWQRPNLPKVRHFADWSNLSLYHLYVSVYQIKTRKWPTIYYISNTSVLTSYFHKDNAKWAYIISRELSEFEIQGTGKKYRNYLNRSRPCIILDSDLPRLVLQVFQKV